MEATKIFLVKSNHTITRSSFLIFRLSIMFIVFVIPFVGTLLFYLRIICRIRQTYTELMGLAAQVLHYNLPCSLLHTINFVITSISKSTSPYRLSYAHQAHHRSLHSVAVMVAIVLTSTIICWAPITIYWVIIYTYE